MSVVERNWQTTRPTIRERSKFMFNNDLYSDVKFVVRGKDSESKQVIPAHKFVLSISSPVFEAMFYGELAETGVSIELPDCDYESLLEMFRYMYSDEVNLSGRDVMGVLYLAKKYIVPSLVVKCTDYLQNHLDPSNVFSIMPFAQKNEEENLVDRCWKVIDEQAAEATKTDGFVTIDRCLLEAVVERDTLNISEVELFKAVNLWATKKCEEQGVSADGNGKRRILGERIVKGIRFPLMKQHEFAGVVLDCKILTPDEVYDIVKYWNSVLNTPLVFSEEGRSFRLHCCRFSSVDQSDLGFPYQPGKKDCLILSVDNDIILLGVTLCGSENNSYSVSLQISNPENDDILYSKSGNFASVRIKSGPGSYYGFTVFFDRPAILKKNVKYRIQASISGANSCFGQNGKDCVVCSGVRFNFKNSGLSGNGTKVGRGQFPEIIFTAK